jgi:hypothetical protein
MGGGKGGAPPPPDYSQIAAANEKAAAIQAEVSREQLAWAKEQYASDREITNKVVNSALRTQDINDQNAAYDRQRYQNLYQPLENEAIAEARNFASPERQRLEMGKAQANVAQQFDAQRNAATQNLESFGIDPSSTRFAALDQGMRIQQAAATAAAGNQAQNMTEAQGRALRSEAINVGRGYPGQVAATYGTALQAGNQAVNSSLAQTASGANTMGTGVQWQQGANQSLANWGNTLHQGYQDQIAAYNANNQGSGWGTALGLIGGAAVKGIMGGMAFAEGGSVPHDASPTNGGAIDDVPARLTAGEFVVPKDVMQWKGEEWAQKEIQKAREAKSQAVAKPAIGLAPSQAPTFTSRPASALPVR